SGQGVYSVGGGIVHDSDPAEEWQECHWKARILRA
ncbi:chorismate-binding protein, partial [Achromobacter denitrificans]